MHTQLSATGRLARSSTLRRPGKVEDDHANVGWVRAAWRDLRRFSTGGTYVNFLTEEEGDERFAQPTETTMTA